MPSTYLTRTTGTPTLGTKCTVSFWWKNSEGKPSGGSDRVIFGTQTTADCYIYLRNTGELGLYQASTGGFDFRTSRLITDSSAWYHICFTFDSTLTTSADRIKIYINGVRETAFNASTTMSQGATIRLNEASKVINIGGGFNQNMDGLLSHINFIDGTAYDASAFGETDATTGEWKINTSPSVTYGNNGFFILKNGNSVTDQSPNTNNFTVGGGTLTNTEDCPSNFFVTLNSLNPTSQSNSQLSNGSTKLTNVGGNYFSRTGNIAVTSGKWYAEVKITQLGGGSQVGIIDITKATGDSWYANAIERAYVYLENGYRYSNDSGGAWGANSYTTGDIIGVAMDLDNNKVYVSKNGTWQNSGDPTSGATGTGAMYSITDGYDYTFVSTTLDSGTDPVHEWNFGNGYFGSTQISSAGTNASGIGIFEYDVPTGYTALSTKGLNL